MAIAHNGYGAFQPVASHIMYMPHPPQWPSQTPHACGRPRAFPVPAANPALVGECPCLPSIKTECVTSERRPIWLQFSHSHAGPIPKRMFPASQPTWLMTLLSDPAIFTVPLLRSSNASPLTPSSTATCPTPSVFCQADYTLFRMH